MKSFNHKCITVCSSVFCIYYISIIYDLIIILFHLQMMSILYFTYNIVCSPTRSSVSHCINHSTFCVYFSELFAEFQTSTSLEMQKFRMATKVHWLDNYT